MNHPSDSNGALIRAMPVVFVLIWSTGFVVARLAMPHAPPLTFLSWRYAASLLAFGAWIALARAPWPQGRAQWGHLAVSGVYALPAIVAGSRVLIEQTLYEPLLDRLGKAAGIQAILLLHPAERAHHQRRQHRRHPQNPHRVPLPHRPRGM